MERHVLRGTITTAITARERTELVSMIRRNERAARAQVEQHCAELRRQFEGQLATTYSWASDEVWAAVTREAEIANHDFSLRVAQRARELGIPDRFAPQWRAGWVVGGEQLFEEHKKNLRRVATLHIAELGKRAVAEITLKATGAMNTIMAAGVVSDEGRALLLQLPSVEQLMPPLQLHDVETLLEQQTTERNRRLLTGY